MKKQMKRLRLAKETLQTLDIGKGAVGEIVGGDKNDTVSVYWSCVPAASLMYTCQC